MADHEEPALPPQPAAAPAAPNLAAPATVVEPLDVPALAAEPEVIFVGCQFYFVLGRFRVCRFQSRVFGSYSFSNFFLISYRFCIL